MKWRCLSCKETVDIDAPEESRHRCPKCSAALVPCTLLARGGISVDYANSRIWRFYCACSQAYVCQQHDQYRPSCEDLVMTPGCLAALFAEVRDLKNLLGNAEKAGDSPNPR